MATRVSDFDQAQAILEERGVQWTGAEVAALEKKMADSVERERDLLEVLARWRERELS